MDVEERAAERNEGLVLGSAFALLAEHERNRATDYLHCRRPRAAPRPSRAEHPFVRRATSTAETHRSLGGEDRALFPRGQAESAGALAKLTTTVIQPLVQFHVHRLLDADDGGGADAGGDEARRAGGQGAATFFDAGRERDSHDGGGAPAQGNLGGVPWSPGPIATLAEQAGLPVAEVDAALQREWRVALDEATRKAERASRQLHQLRRHGA